jgi:hypothetical protein
MCFTVIVISGNPTVSHIFMLLIINSNFNLYVICTLSSTFDNLLCFLYLNSSYTYQLVLQLLHNCLLKFSILCCIIYPCIYSGMLFMLAILCVDVLSCVDIFHIQLSYGRYWIFSNVCMYVRMFVCMYVCMYVTLQCYNFFKCQLT